MRSTGERHSPDQIRTDEDSSLDLRHRYAYQVARGFALPATRVLEVGFGEGYGASMLADAVASYEGVEVSEPMVRHARDRYETDQVNFHLYDGMRLPFGDAAFDLVISFQVIEHVEDVDRYARELRRTCATPGTILVTTPNRLLRLAEGERPWNRYHRVEFSPSELADVLGAHFPDVKLTGIHAAPEVMEMELRRLKRMRRLARLDRFGFRYILPDGMTGGIARSLGRALGRRSRGNRPGAMSLAQFWHSEEGLENSLDLLAFIRL